MEQQTAILIGGNNWKDLLENYISKNGEENLEVLLSIPLTKDNEEHCKKLSHLITFKNFYKTKPNNINMTDYTNADNIIDLQNNNNNNNLYKNTLLQGVTIHLLGIPSLPVQEELRFSPYVGIAESMAEILDDLNLRTIFYGTEGSEIKCSDFIDVVSKEEFNAYARDKDPLHLSTQSFFHREHLELWGVYFERLLVYLESNISKGDLILLPHSLYGKYLEEFKTKWDGVVTFIEYSAGYHDKWANHSVFPSNYQQFTVKTIEEYKQNKNNGYYPIYNYDFVIPHSFDHKKYKVKEKPSKDYLLFLGRVQHSKGWNILRELANNKDVTLPIKIAGPVAGGAITKELNKGIEDGIFIYEGVVGMDKKVELLSNAKALLAPSEVSEIFHMAAVEAMLCGTPVICSESGGLVENIITNKTGYICKMLSDYIDAINSLDNLDRSFIADYAIINFSNEANKYRYEEFFRRIHDLALGKGWYSIGGWNLGAVSKTSKLDRKKALVVVAHQDDELIDHGNFLKKSKDTDITLVVATKPSDITPNLDNLSLDRLEKVRKLETLSFCASLGIEDIRFLDLEDGKLNKLDFELEIKKIVNSIKPDIILTHPLDDGHSDHAKISKVIHSNFKKNITIRCRTQRDELYNDDVNWKLDMLHKYFKSQVPILRMESVVDQMTKENTYI